MRKDRRIDGFREHRASDCGRVTPVRETELHPPVKAFLEAQGYAVKGEVESCDLVAVRGDEAPVIVELKTSSTLGLVVPVFRRRDVDVLERPLGPGERDTTCTTC